MGIVCAQDRKSVIEKAYRDGADSPVDIFSKYSIKKQILGKGQFGVVRKAVCRATGKQFAIKTTPKRKLNQTLSDIQSQLKGLKALNHPNIIKYYQIYQDDSNFYEVMQLATGKDLLDAEGLSESKVAQIMKSAFSAVSYLHSKGLIHRDLKPNNFMYASEDPNAELVLIDFGFSRLVEESELLETRLGTPYYLAPEVIDRSYDLRSEYWSLGVMMHYLLVGRHPFVGSNVAQTMKEIQEAELELEGPEWDAVSSDAKDLLRKLLKKNPLKRITVDEALQHPWIRMSRNAKTVSEKSQPKQKVIADNQSTDICTISDLDRNDFKVKLNLDVFSIRGSSTASTELSSAKTTATLERDVDNIFLDSLTSN